MALVERGAEDRIGPRADTILADIDLGASVFIVTWSAIGLWLWPTLIARTDAVVAVIGACSAVTVLAATIGARIDAEVDVTAARLA